MTVRVGIGGISGRLGREIVVAAEDDPLVQVTGGFSRSEGSLDALLPVVDVIIDVTRADATVDVAERCAEAGIPFVTGTTGLDAAQSRRLARAAERIPVFAARNLSVGIAALMTVLPDLVAALDGFDIEIIETHHRHKVDAPSGTALALLEAIRSAPGSNDPALVHGRFGHGLRRPGEVGIHSVRAGGNPGEHTVILADAGEEIRISHRAFSRRPYALGALRAAHWVVGRPPGQYGMADLLA
jgi:4-hydroxy-tetrahydrodipicolinate reductase